MSEKTAIPKLRLDALTDGVFAVAMTLLVIDLKLPENFIRRTQPNCCIVSESSGIRC